MVFLTAGTYHIEPHGTNNFALRIQNSNIVLRGAGVGQTLILEANGALHIEDHGRPRIFNLVPGFEAVPVFAEIPPDGAISCRIRMMA